MQGNSLETAKKSLFVSYQKEVLGKLDQGFELEEAIVSDKLKTVFLRDTGAQ